MKPKPKLPRARVMWAHHADLKEHKGTPSSPLEMVENKSLIQGFYSGTLALHDTPCLVRPMPSLKSARAKAKWENLSEEEKVERVARAISRVDGRAWGIYSSVYRLQARACLAAMEGAP